MTGKALGNANRMAQDGATLAEFVARRDFVELLERTHVDWDAQRLSAAPEPVRQLLDRLTGTSGAILSHRAQRLLGKLQLDIEDAARVGRGVLSRYSDLILLARGRNSVTFLATHPKLGTQVVLKIVRPGSARDLDAALRLLGELSQTSGIVTPIDYFEISTTTVSGDTLALKCVVFPFVEGPTLQAYLADEPPLSPYFFETFVRQVATVLEAMERKGLRHGDLHAGNILVTTNGNVTAFRIIDPSPGIDTPSGYDDEQSDYAAFKAHLGRSLRVLQKHLPRLSMQKHLGARLFFMIRHLLDQDELTFAEVLRVVEANPPYEAWLRERREFVEARFATPQPLGLLRWEEIASPEQAIELFEPYPELFARMQTFGNTLLFGARGSGKSTYLAALAYFPSSPTRLVSPDRIFGLFFPCRQGEFKQLSAEFVRFDGPSRLRVKHILVLKIIRRLLASLCSAVETRELSPPTDFEALCRFLEPFLAERRLDRYPQGVTAQLASLVAEVSRHEALEIDELFKQSSAGLSPSRLLDERFLVEFCESIRRQFSALGETQFYFLFDDAGDPNMRPETQKILNDLVTSSNSVYCIKLSAEKFSYHLVDSSGRALEETHDFNSFDIATAYLGGSGIEPERAEVRDYFTRIVGRRLRFWRYRFDDITRYLGSEPTSVDTLVQRLAAGRRNAYYAGWEVVWQLADRTPRNLVELVSEVFAHAHLKPATDVAEGGVAPRVQDRAIRSVSTKRLRSLEYVPGEVPIFGRRQPLGLHLYVCATTFGAVARAYLRRVSPPEERLAIERNDSMRLGPDAEEVLRALIRYGVFDDSTLGVAFDDRRKKPIYVFNRILCPAFSLSFRRDSHLRLSREAFEGFLLRPTRFSRKGTGMLRDISEGRETVGLFDTEEA